MNLLDYNHFNFEVKDIIIKIKTIVCIINISLTYTFGTDLE